MGEVNLGTLYDMNKMAMKDAKALTTEEVIKAIGEMADLYNANGNCEFHYFMLLCRDIYDFTLFSNADNGRMLRTTSFIADLAECLVNRGEVLSIEKVENEGKAFEIWMRLENFDTNEKEVFVYYFFPYDEGVIVIQ